MAIKPLRHRIEEHSNVNRADVPVTGDALEFTDPLWHPDPGGGGGPHNVLSATHADSDAADVPAGGDVLTWSGTQWVASPGGAPGAHALTHEEGGVDPVAIEDLPTATLTAARYPRTDGVGGIAIAQVAHTELGSVTADQHHAQAHAVSGADHSGAISDAQHGARGPIVGAHGHDDLDTVTADQHHLENHDHDGAPTQTLLAANTHGTPSPNTHHNQAHDLDGADHTLAGEVAGEFLRATGATTFALEVVPFSVGGVVLDPTGARFVMVWRAPFACTVTNVRGHRKGGTGATVNARRNQTSDHLASDLSLGTADAWADGGAVQNTAYIAGDDLEIEVASITGAVTEIAIQVDFTRP